MIVHNNKVVVNNGRWINYSQPSSIKRHVNILSNPGGTIIAEPVEGYDGYVVKLSHTDNSMYTFMNYNVSGARLYNDRYFRFEGSDVTVSGTWQFSTQWLCDNWVKIGDQIWTSKNLEIDDGGPGIYRVDNVTTPGGINFGTQYYYTASAAKRIVDTIPGWSIPRNGEGSSQAAGYKLSWRVLTYNSTAYTLKSTYGWERGTNGDNSTGFNALPVGLYDIGEGRVNGIGSNAGWLSTDKDGNINNSDYNAFAGLQWDDACINDQGDGHYIPYNQLSWYTTVRLVKNDSNPPVCV